MATANANAAPGATRPVDQHVEFVVKVRRLFIFSGRVGAMGVVVSAGYKTTLVLLLFLAFGSRCLVSCDTPIECVRRYHLRRARFPVGLTVGCVCQYGVIAFLFARSGERRPVKSSKKKCNVSWVKVCDGVSKKSRRSCLGLTYGKQAACC